MHVGHMFPRKCSDGGVASETSRFLFLNGYYIWSERNSRLHRRIFKPPDSISKQIEATIRSKISALRDQSLRLSSSLFAVWNA
ncbi:hypothetical protein Bca4012_044889 [Brassica carinata]